MKKLLKVWLFIVLAGFISAPNIQAQEYRLWGTTNGTIPAGPDGYGNIFSLRLDGTDVTKVYALNGTDGAILNSGVIQGKDGYLYGTTRYGGVNNLGTVFKVKIDGSGFKKLFDFNGINGEDPHPGVIQGPDDHLYGMTTGGGINHSGTVFKINIDGTGFVKLFDLHHILTGYSPRSNLLLAANGSFYGTAYSGGANSKGTIFKINLEENTLIKLKDFGGVDGEYPNGSLIQGPDGYLYGTCALGGAFDHGTIFRIRPDGTDFEKLFSFDITTGSTPLSTLLLSDNEFLYGTTVGGGGAYDPMLGTFYYGTVYKIRPDGTEFMKVNNFGLPEDGILPLGGLTQLADGTLFGITSLGGINDKGTIYRIENDGVSYSKVYDFEESIGSGPTRSLSLFPIKTYQSMVFEPTDKALGDSPFTLQATSESGFEPEYFTTSDKVSLSGNQISFLKAGRVEIGVSQSGNETFYAAPKVFASFCINPEKPVITATNLGGFPILTSASGEAKQWYKDGIEIEGATGNSYEANESGIYSLKITVENCISEEGSYPLIVTGNSDEHGLPKLHIYPNPATNSIFINLRTFSSQEKTLITIYDLSGKLVGKSEIIGNEGIITVSSYPRGEYLLKAKQRQRTYLARIFKD